MTAEVAQMRRTSPWRVLEDLALRRILVSFGISKIGDLLYATSLLVVVLRSTGSPGWVSVAVVAHFLPMAVVTPFAGVLADRMDRLRLMILSDVGRLVLMVLAAVVVATDAPVVLLVVIAFLSSSVGTPFGSSLLALLPELVPEDRLPAANSVIQMLYQVGYLAGPVLATLVLRSDVRWLPFALNAGTFVLSAALLSGLRERRPASATGPAAGEAADAAACGPEGPQESFGAAFLTGVRTVLGNPFLRELRSGADRGVPGPWS